MAFRMATGFLSAAPSSVWVVDDDEDDRLFIRSAFEDMESPIRVLTLSDGDQLLPQLNQADTLPQLILLDINMVRQDGFETLAQLRRTPSFANLPVVMMTTSSDEGDQKRSLALGASQCLTKPNNYHILVSMVKRLTEQWVLV